MFTEKFKRYACEGDFISTTVGEFDAIATIYRDDCSEAPDERIDGFWPSCDPKSAGYVRPENFKKEQAKAQRAMNSWLKDGWFYCGIAVTIIKDGVTLTGKYDNALWGVECNYPGSDNSYLTEVANQLLGEAIDCARATLRRLCA